MLPWVKQRVEDIVKTDEAWAITLPDSSAKISSLKEIKGEVSCARSRPVLPAYRRCTGPI